MYGSETNDNPVPEVGIQENVTYKGVKIDEGRLVISFRQENDSLISHKEWEANPQWDIEEQQRDTTRRLFHIAEAMGIEFKIDETESFENFVNQLTSQFPKPEDVKDKFRMLFIYNKKNFVCLPKFPKFIEKMSTEPTTIKISAYNQDRLNRVEPDPEPADTQKDDNKKSLPF